MAESWFERSKVVRKVKVRCRSLDNVLSEQEPSMQFHFLKVDAQGAEYEILRGAEKLLSTSCIGLHLELFVFPILKGIKLLKDVEIYLNGFGFELVREFPSNATFSAAPDCLFLKREQTEIVETIKDIYALE